VNLSFINKNSPWTVFSHKFPAFQIFLAKAKYFKAFMQRGNKKYIANQKFKYHDPATLRVRVIYASSHVGLKGSLKPVSHRNKNSNKLPYFYVTPSKIWLCHTNWAR